MVLTNSLNFTDSTPVSASLGGTGVSDPSANGILVANGASAFSSLVLTDGQFLIGVTGGAPIAASISAGANMVLTPGAGSLSVAFDPSANVTFTGDFNVNTASSMDFTCGDEVLWSVTGGLFEVDVNTGNINLLSSLMTVTAATLALSNIPAATANQVVYIDSTTKELSRGAPPAFDGSLNYSTTGQWDNSGTWNFTGDFDINSPAQAIRIRAGSVDIEHIGGAPGDDLQLTSVNRNVDINAQFGVIVGSSQGVSFTATSVSSNISFTASSSNITLDSPAVRLPSIPTSVQSNVLYRNVNNEITVGAAPVSAVLPVVDVTGTTQTAAVNTAYIASNATSVNFTLPSSPTAGQVVEIYGSTGNFVVTAAGTQTIRLGAAVTSAGGTLTSSLASDSVCLKALTAGTGAAWRVYASVGNSFNLV